MSLPKKVNIMDHIYKVKIVDDLHMKNGIYLYGAVDHTRRIIKINSGMHPEVEKTTLVHEMLHAVIHIAGHSDLDDAIEERITDCISQALLPLLKTNPKLFNLKRK